MSTLLNESYVFYQNKTELERRGSKEAQKSVSIICECPLKE